MINQAREVFCQRRFPASLIYVLIVSLSPAVPSTFMPLPSRNTSTGRPVVLDTALLPLSFLPSSAKETICDFLCPDGSALHGTSRQSDTHSNESREVRYPWHPWHARAVTVHEAFTRNGRAVCRCSVDGNPGVRLLEIPQWMFDSVACCRMYLTTVPTVSCGALLDLKALLRCASFPDSDVVLQVQHRSLLTPGGADAKITNPTESRSIQTISSTPEAPVLAGAAARNQTKSGTVAGAAAARAHRKSRRLRQQKGGGR
jgi:hypothetical protein